MKKLAFVAFILAAGSAQADVQRGGTCFTNHADISGAKVTWNCEHIGRVTTRQVYEKGFRVVGVYPTDPANRTIQYQYMVIEEQRG